MANRRSFLAALWDGGLVGAAGALVAGILHMIVMLVFLLVLTAVSPILSVAMPFIAYQMSGDDVQLLALVYFILGAFAVAIFTGAVYCWVTRKERRAAGETFGQHCRNVGLWPIASILCSWISSGVFALLFKDLLISDSNMAHAIFFALAPIAVFSPLWVYLIYRKRQKDEHQRIRFEWKQRSAAWEAARDEEEALWQKMQDDDCKRKDAAWLRSQGIVN
jgi:hypothetical protein